MTRSVETVHFAPEGQFRESVSVLFRRVEAELRSLLPAADVQHVGSTAIPGSLTKGDLDVQVRVPADEFEGAKHILSKIYAVNAGGFTGDDAVSFEDYTCRPSLGVHLTVVDGSADIQWRFRDVLLERPDLREEYDGLKRRFHGGSMSEYREAKAEFVDKILQIDADRRAARAEDASGE